MAASLPPFEVFRAGTHVDMGGRELTFSAADIAAMAAAFNPAQRGAPLVVGHPSQDAPAYGWVDKLEARGGSLWAHPVDAEPAFAELVRTKRFPNRSIMLLPPGGAGNPSADAYYLKHVGFLGAQAPAVQGLKPIAFSADEEAVQIGFMERGTAWRFASIGRLFRGFREQLIADKDLETADRIVPSYAVEDLEAAGHEAEVTPLPAFTEPSKEPDVTDTTAERQAALDARERELAAKEQKLQAQEHGFAEREAQDRRTEDAALVDRLVAEGRLLPAMKADTLAFMADLSSTGEATIAFAEGGAKHTPRAAFHALLGRLPKVVPLGELATGDGGTQVDVRDPVAINREAVAYQERERVQGREVTIIDAVDHVMKGKAA